MTLFFGVLSVLCIILSILGIDKDKFKYTTQASGQEHYAMYLLLVLAVIFALCAIKAYREEKKNKVSI
jgi:integral membrane sensor domain MASE1